MPSDTPYFDPNDPNMGSQSDASQREAGNQDVMASLTQRVQANWQYQQWLASRGGRLSDAERKQAAQLLQNAGLSLPDGMEVNAQGQVVPIDHTTRNRIIAAAMAAPLLLPSSAAGAGAAGATGAGGGAGAGGMSGLAGSGYVVPSASLGAGGGAAGTGGLAGLMGADQVVPSAALGANGGIGAAGAIGGAGTAGGARAASGSGAAGTGTAGGAGSWLRNIGRIAPLAGVLGGQALSGRGSGGNNSMSPELQQLLAQALKRMSSQDGLFAAVNKQAMAGLPTIYQQ